MDEGVKISKGNINVQEMANFTNTIHFATGILSHFKT